MRCSDCTRLVSIETDAEPEVDLEVEGAYVVGTVRIVNCCNECGKELREQVFNVHETIKGAEEHQGEDHDLQVDAELERTEERRPPRKQRQYTYYGAEGYLKVTCSCLDEGTVVDAIKWSAEVRASHMDEV